MQPYALTCHRLTEPIAICRLPELSWKVRSDRPGDVQTAYQIVIRTDAALLWDSGRVDSNETLDLCPSISLTPFTKYHWSVRVWDTAGVPSEYAPEASFETGPLTDKDWSAGWISSIAPENRSHAPQQFGPFVENPQPSEIIYFRGTLDVPSGDILRARLYLASEKSCYVHLDGTPLSQWPTAPMTRNMKHRLLFLTYDVTDTIHCGPLALGIESHAGNVIAQLVVTYADGHRAICGTGDTFRFWSGATRLAPLESGEIFDARLEPAGWDTTGFDDSDWAPVYPGVCPAPRLDPNTHPPLSVRKSVHPRVCRQMPDGAWVFELDEITVGAFRLTGSAPAGTQISVTLSEQRLPDGSVLHLKNSFVPDACESVSTNYFTFRGSRQETFAPKFAFSSFQYVEVRDYPGVLTAEDLWVDTIQTPMRRISSFRCSNDLFNTLYENMCRTVENDAHDGLGSTYLDEKGTFIGGDASFAGEAILYTEDIVPIFRQEIGNMLDGQTETGAFREPGQPGGVPGHPNTTPEWDSTALHLTKYMDDYAGLRSHTALRYDALRHYMDAELAELRKNDYLEDSNTGGDWNSPESEFAPEGGLISGSACDYRSYAFLTAMARMLGREADIPSYHAEMVNIAEAINRRFLKNGCYETDTTEYIPLYGGPTGWAKAGTEKQPVGYRQASNLIPLVYDITPQAQREAVFQSLLADIRAKDSHLDTGCIASKYLLTHLTDMGQTELAYTIADQRTFPSWGYWVTKGATTMWEHWRYDSRSRNHFFLGAGIQEWFFKSLGGFRDMKEGFKTVTIRPAFPRKLDFLSVSTDTARGTFRLDWRRENGKILAEISIPANTTARVELPADSRCTSAASPETGIYGGGSYRFEIPCGVAE